MKCLTDSNRHRSRWWRPYSRSEGSYALIGFNDDGSYALIGFSDDGMEMQVDDPNFLSNILGEVEAGAGLEDMDIGLTQDTQPHDETAKAEAEQTLPKKRSDGIKKVKANMKRGGGEACMEALDKMMAKREVLEKAKEARFMASLEVEKAALELEKKRVASEEKKAEAKLLKEEKDIMLADMSSLTPTQRAWVEKKQKMIMEKMEEN
ncbi:unnamed protein product [Miscanthus lutarioriparius]|uniref:No apical meristem-associated C-terminal domain-containing protein n=1 Tax=Miscanthus lutarioriparius TaxID=422564 RepID=A0A811REN7_9POAL|nr:unnamed protein product [Miscanthus lutarioriparius]